MADLEREQIYSFFKENPEKPWHVQDVQKRLGIGDRAWLNRELSELADAGQLIRTRRRTFGLPQEMNLVLGRLQVTAGGYGFVIPDADGESDLFVPADDLGGAWDGDKVMARPNPLKKEGDRVSGKVVRILARKHQRMVGTLEYSRGYAILRPDSPRLRGRILLTSESVGDTSAGSRLVATIVWPEDSGEREPFGEVAEVLGDGDDPEIETRAVMIKFDLKPEFEPETLAEARAVPDAVTSEMMAGRSDMRKVMTFTVDGEDAKDFDDAISLERLKGEGKSGLLRVGVHIADVSYYVAEGTNLDKEARERATSVYLPGEVLPMLPEELSNGICSLVEGEARLCLSVLIDMSREGEVKGVTFKETVIQSDARLTYEQVQEFVGGGRLPQGKRKLERDIKALLQITQSLREARLGSGALDFNFTEAKVDVDKDGALHLMPIRSNQARQLVEEMMLLANRLVAQDLSKRDIPALYRVHEDPSEAKFQDLQKALGKLGYTLDLEHTTPADLQTILKQAAGKPEAQLVNTLLLRSLKQARYSADNLGHFGLAFENYLHFTSPIRRYPDLVVHRVLRASLQHRLSPTLKERMRTDFPALAEHASQRERVAEEAERDLSRYFHARWAAEHRGEEFQGFITGVTNFGVFVGLANAVEGLIHVSNLDDDYYMYLEDAMMLMGKSTRRRFKMGEPLKVRILDANPTVRQIDLLPSYLPMPSEAELEETRREAKTHKRSPSAKPQPSQTQAAKDPRRGRSDKPAESGQDRAPRGGDPRPAPAPAPGAPSPSAPAPSTASGATAPLATAFGAARGRRRYKLVFGNSKLEE